MDLEFIKEFMQREENLLDFPSLIDIQTHFLGLHKLPSDNKEKSPDYASARDLTNGAGFFFFWNSKEKMGL